MTERFKLDNGDLWDSSNGEVLMLDFEQNGVPRIVDLLNELNNENEQLKQSFINLIDEKIKEYQKYDEYDTEKFYIGTQLLNELKKELKGDVE